MNDDDLKFINSIVLRNAETYYIPLRYDPGKVTREIKKWIKEWHKAAVRKMDAKLEQVTRNQPGVKVVRRETKKRVNGLVEIVMIADVYYNQA